MVYTTFLRNLQDRASSWKNFETDRPFERATLFLKSSREKTSPHGRNHDGCERTRYRLLVEEGLEARAGVFSS